MGICRNNLPKSNKQILNNQKIKLAQNKWNNYNNKCNKMEKWMIVNNKITRIQIWMVCNNNLLGNMKMTVMMTIMIMKNN